MCELRFDISFWNVLALTTDISAVSRALRFIQSFQLDSVPLRRDMIPLPVRIAASRDTLTHQHSCLVIFHLKWAIVHEQCRSSLEVSVWPRRTRQRVIWLHRWNFKLASSWSDVFSPHFLLSRHGCQVEIPTSIYPTLNSFFLGVLKSETPLQFLGSAEIKWLYQILVVP